MTQTTSLIRPDWIRVRAPGSEAYAATRTVLDDYGVVTVCREALCPNQAECWADRTATFMICGDTCTRGCRFCAVATAKSPPPPDPTEPERVALAAAALQTRFAVLTSVDRDDLPDQGARHWAKTIRALKQHTPSIQVEALTPDFRGDLTCLDTVLDAGPEVFSHNLETVPSLYDTIRPGAHVDWSLSLLSHATRSGFIAKTGLMLGFGETEAELLDFLARAVESGVQILTLGQYLQPTPRHAPIKRYVTPEQFADLGERARALGFAVVEAGPLVRSSYHAHRHAQALARH